MPTSRLRKPSYLNRLLDSTLDVNAQLHKARTEEERDFCNKKLRELEMQRQEHLAKLAKRYRDRKAAARRKKMDSWR